MKEYRLSSWPDLPAEYQHTRYQRVLHDMSQRFMSLKQLSATSSMDRGEVRAFVRMLALKEMILQRQRPDVRFSFRSWMEALVSEPLLRLLGKGIPRQP